MQQKKNWDQHHVIFIERLIKMWEDMYYPRT